MQRERGSVEKNLYSSISFDVCLQGKGIFFHFCGVALRLDGRKLTWTHVVRSGWSERRIGGEMSSIFVLLLPGVRA